MWGSGKDGRCGNNSEDGFKIPTHIKVMSGKAGKMAFSSLDCGYHHTAAVSDKGQVYTWGRGVFGQLGHGSTDNIHVPTMVRGIIYKKTIIQVACGW